VAVADHVLGMRAGEDVANAVVTMGDHDDRRSGTLLGCRDDRGLDRAGRTQHGQPEIGDAELLGAGVHDLDRQLEPGELRERAGGGDATHGLGPGPGGDEQRAQRQPAGRLVDEPDAIVREDQRGHLEVARQRGGDAPPDQRPRSPAARWSRRSRAAARCLGSRRGACREHRRNTRGRRADDRSRRPSARRMAPHPGACSRARPARSRDRHQSRVARGGQRARVHEREVIAAERSVVNAMVFTCDL
jgi:hypothetical protein